MASPYEPSYLQGIAHFNDRRFFEAHEAWEEVWMPCQGEARRFYQGLIQIAVCLHHFGRGNTRGARKLYHSSRRYLADYPPWHLGIDLQRLLADMDRCLAELVASDEASPRIELNAELLPRIHFCET
jgi:predicted metal-dependent hydrolase